MADNDKAQDQAPSQEAQPEISVEYKSCLVPLSDECILRLDIFKRLTRDLWTDILRSDIQEDKGAPFKWEEAALGIIEAIRGECCVAFWESLILHAKKAINRHAKSIEDTGGWSGHPPKWATKYKKAGV